MDATKFTPASTTFPRITSTLPRSALFVALLFGGMSGVNAMPNGMENWREYALRSVVPAYSWSDSRPAVAAAPTVLDVVRSGHFANVSLRVSGNSGVPKTFTLSFDQAPVGTAAASGVQQFAPVDWQARRSPLHNNLMGASYNQSFRDVGTFGVTALFAQQFYASPGMGLAAGRDILQNERFFDTPNYGWRESVSGQGMRMDFISPQLGDWSWMLSAQSRVGVDSFQSVHGIYGEPGDFDLPARMSTHLAWDAGASTTLVLGVEQVFYGNVKPFTSTALPARLLSLMASGGAPVFEWQDLTVYSVEGRMQDHWEGVWSLRVSSRQQPTPTADIYQQALASEYASRAYAFGYRRDMGRFGELSFAASHASSMAFLGAGSRYGRSGAARGSQTEVELAWAVPF